MRPTPAVGRGIEQPVLKTPAVSNAWQLGTLLKAIVLSDSSNGAVQLQIGARVVTAQTTLSLQTGQAIRLQVAETGRTVLLRAVAEPLPGNLIREGIKQNLPRQIPQTPLLAAALSLSKSGGNYSADLVAAANRLVGAMRDPAAITQGQGLRLAVRDSGIFLEQRLARLLSPANRTQGAALSRDWKAALLTLRNQLTQFHSRLVSDGAARQPTQSPTQAIQTASNGNPQAPVPAVSLTPARPGAAPINAPTVVYPVPAGAPGVATLISGSVLPNPATVTTVSPASPTAAPQSTDVSTLTSPANMRQSAGVGDMAAPMRHALPNPQPVAQAGNLPADALSLVSELIGNNDGALARVRLNQFASIAPDHGSRLVWLLELPVRHADNSAEVVTLRIEKDEQGDDERTQSAWTADLAFDLATKGQLRARVALRAGRVSVSFWADADQTRAEVQGKLPQLKSAMKEKQLDVATLSAGAGRPPAPAAPSASLLETQA